MPLIRKPTAPAPTTTPDSVELLRLLASPSPEERWAAARAAPNVAGGISAIAAALAAERDPRIREAMLTSLAGHGGAESADAVIGLLRSDRADLRTDALDALRIMAAAEPGLLPSLFHDEDVDVRILSCELARSLPSAEATRLLCALLAAEEEINVCAAAIDVLAEVGNTEAIAPLLECGRRFGGSPFITFAIKIATDRIRSQSATTRA